MPVQVLSTPALYAVWDKAGERLAYSDQKGYEMEWRKHDNSSFARDVWVWDRATNTHRRLTASGVDDRQPVWAPGERALYYLSEKSGSFNVWRLDLADPQHPVQVTTHTVHPVRFLSVSAAGDLCYTFDGEIWVRPAGAAESRKLDVTAAADRRDLAVAPLDVSGEVSEFELSPDGKEVAFVARGEVFVASVEHGTTRRITDTPGQERSVSFSPDGKSLLYAGERDGSWNLYRTDRTDPEEPDFFNATALKESAVLATPAEEFQPRFSPDGKEVAYLEERTTLKVLNLASGKSRIVLPGDMNYSYADGDQWYEWSPDGRTFAVQFLSPTRWSSEVGLVPAAGGAAVDEPHAQRLRGRAPALGAQGRGAALGDRPSRRAPAGRLAARAGRLRRVPHAQGVGPLPPRRGRATRSSPRRRRRRTRRRTRSKDKDKDEGRRTRPPAEKPAAKLPDPVTLELDAIEDRIVRLSMHSADLADADLTPDGETLVYLAKFEKGYDLWKYVPRKKEIKLLAKLDAERSAAFHLDAEGKKAVVLADDKHGDGRPRVGQDHPGRSSRRSSSSRRRGARGALRARLAPDAEEVLRREPCTASTGPR